MNKRLEKAKLLKKDFLTNELTRLVRVKDPITGGEIQVPVVRALYLKLIDMALHKGDMRALERLMAEVKGTAANSEMENSNAISKMTYMVLKNAGVSIGEGLSVTDAEIMEEIGQARVAEQTVILDEDEQQQGAEKLRQPWGGAKYFGSGVLPAEFEDASPDALVDFAIRKTKKVKFDDIDF